MGVPGWQKHQILPVHVRVSGAYPSFAGTRPCFGKGALRGGLSPLQQAPHLTAFIVSTFSVNCLHCTLLLALLSYSVSPCSLLSLRLCTGHTLITEKLFSLGLDLRGFVSFFQNTLSCISLYYCCSYRSKPRGTQKETFSRMYMLVFSIRRNQTMGCQTPQSTPYN